MEQFYEKDKIEVGIDEAGRGPIIGPMVLCGLLVKEEDEKKDLYEKVLSRESETKADQNGARMIINAGYPNDTCLKSLTFLSKKNYTDAHTELKSTHPGHLERYESLKIFIDSYDKEVKTLKPYKWSWRYNRNLNILTFSPKK